MDAIQTFLKWAKDQGILINGIGPKALPGRGIGLVTTKNLEEGEIILDIPTAALKTLDTVPKSTSKALPKGIAIHGLLAADICLDTSASFAIWKAVLPSKVDIRASIPLAWDPKLQAHLPPIAKQILGKQKTKYAKDWIAVSKAFPSITDEEYLHAWLLVNSRTFYFVTPKTEKHSRDDRICLQPVADLFNHAAHGCPVAFDAESYTIKTDRAYAKDEEIYICYGRHSNDFLLAEYGFTLADNEWDEAGLDDVILPELTARQKALLEEVGFLGNYKLDSETVCHRTQVALRMICMPVTSWRLFVEGVEDGEAEQAEIDRLLLTLLWKYEDSVDEEIEEIQALDAGYARNMLEARWKQILALIARTIQRLES